MKFLIILCAVSLVAFPASNLRQSCYSQFINAMAVFVALENANDYETLQIINMLALYRNDLVNTLVSGGLSRPTRGTMLEVVELSILVHTIDFMIHFAYSKSPEDAVTILRLLEHIQELL